MGLRQVVSEFLIRRLSENCLLPQIWCKVAVGVGHSSICSLCCKKKKNQDNLNAFKAETIYCHYLHFSSPDANIKGTTRQKSAYFCPLICR